MIWSLMFAPRASRLAPPLSPFLRAAAVCLLLASVSCSQNSFTWDKPVPPAPTHPRNAHVVKKEGAGMNAVSAPEEAPAPSDGSAFEGTVALSPAAASQFKPGSTLFVIARAVDGNPTPVAAIKLRVDAFPAAFKITAADSMGDGTLPGQVDLLVRLDDDGDLTTQHPGDMAGGPVRASAGQPAALVLSPAGK